MEERVDIEITDKISPNIERKLVKIATAAEEANKALLKVSRNLSKIQTKEINALSSAQAKLDATSTKTAIALQKIATESSRTAVAQAKMVTATQKAATASVQLSTAQARLNATQSQAAAAADRAATAHLRLERAQNQAHRSAGFLAEAIRSVYIKLMGLYAVSQSVGAIVRMVDEYTFLENRLRAVGVSSNELAGTMTKLQDVANGSRNTLKSTVELYARLGQSTKQAGYSQKELLLVTTAMNQAIRIGGSTAQEGSNALIQLSQGMSSGRLQGDELRSVLEQLPIVADVIAKHLGITRGELRKFGREGKLTTQAIMEAFMNAAPELQARFKTLTMTVDEALTYFKNKLQVALKDELGNTIQALAKLIVVLADNIDTLVTAAKALVAVGAIIAGGKLIGWATRFGTQLITAAQAAGILGAGTKVVATGFDALTTGALTAGSRIDGLRGSLNRLNTAAKANIYLAALASLWGVKEAVDNVVAERQENKAVRKSVKETDNFGKVQLRLAGQLQQARADGDTGEVERLTKKLAENRYTWAGTPMPTVEEAVQQSAPTTKTGSDGEGSVAKAEEQLNFTVTQTDYAALRAQYDPIYAAQKQYLELLDKVDQAVWDGAMTEVAATRLRSKAAEAYYNELRPMEKLLNDLKEERDLIGLTNEEREVAVKLRELQTTYTERGLTLAPEVLSNYRLELQLNQALNQAYAERINLISTIKGSEKGPTVQQVTGMVKQGAVTRDEAQGYFVRENTTIFEGSKEAMDANVAAYAAMYAKIDALRQAGYMSEESASKAKVNLWFKEHEILINGTADTFGNLAQLSESSNKKLSAIGRVAANLQLAMNSVRAITLAWASAPFPWNVPAVTATTTAMAIQEAKLNGLAGFAFGGDFTVGGTGGIDSQTVAFRATPGEQVSITTPEQRARQGESSGTTNVYHYHDHVEGGTKAERESRFAQFQRDTRTVQSNRTSARAQVSV